jgi:hypothetical protein
VHLHRLVDYILPTLILPTPVREPAGWRFSAVPVTVHREFPSSLA